MSKADALRTEIKRRYVDQLDPWVFSCEGKARKGDSAGTAELHVWRRKLDRTAYCLKCGTTLTVEQAERCFTDGR